MADLQVSLLRTAEPSLIPFAQQVDEVRAHLVTHKQVLSRMVVTRLVVRLLPPMSQQTTLIGLESLKEAIFYGPEIKKIG